MTAQLALFFDDGGVLNDNALRGPQWQRLVAEYLAPRLGGRPEAWAHANRVVAEQLFADLEARLREHPSFLAFWADMDRAWLREMCALVGIPVPEDDGPCLALARETFSYVTRRVRAAFPEVVEVLQALHRRGYRLLTASGEFSAELEGYLEGMGVRHLFAPRLYGPDLVTTAKLGPSYYERIFADAGVSPGHAVILDDSPRVLAWAAEAGARTILVARNDAGAAGPFLTVRSLAEVPALLARLEPR
jgi:HAD superfamily hydrolase (TIGR01509 family)